MSLPYDALLLVSFGGPEGRDDIMPFLRNVVKGRNVPDARLKSVVEHYEMFDGVSPINEQNRQLIRSLEALLKVKGPQLPIYWGNRNWHPMLSDTVARMKEDGIRRALAFVTSAYGSFSSCRQYLTDIAGACTKAGKRAPRVDKLRLYFNHPGFIRANSHHLQEAMSRIPEGRQADCKVVFTAHSIPESLAASSPYEKQLKETASLIAAACNLTDWSLCFQSRSGQSPVPWLEPDISVYIREMHEMGAQDLVILPIGFVSDHMEVIYDLDVEARNLCELTGINMVRASTVGTHPDFIEMIRDLIVERMNSQTDRTFAGDMGAAPDSCPEDCCPATIPTCRPGSKSND